MPTFLLMLLSVVAAGEPSGDMPYLAEIVNHDAAIYAGPGKRHYVTDRLPKGTLIEVHRREAAGWLAIRPPEGSFSWVPASELKETDDPDVYEVVGEEAASWLGSRVEKIREHKFHIKLQPGEQVEVLGEKRVPGEDGEEQIWYKIAPPAGEFRWVHSRDLGRREAQPAATVKKNVPKPQREELASAAPPAATTPLEPLKPQFRPRSTVKLNDIGASETKPAAFSELTRDPPSADRIRPAAWIESPATKETPAAPPEIKSVDLAEYERSVRIANGEPVPKTDGFVPRGSKRPSEATPTTPPGTPPSTFVPPIVEPKAIGSGIATKLPTAVPIGSASITPIEPQGSGASGGPKKTLTRTEFDNRLAEIDGELSLMVARDPRTWELARLQLQLEQLIEQGDTATERGRARLLAEKIHKFAESFKVEDNPRFAGIAPPSAQANPPTNAVGTGLKATDIPALTDPKYDGTGWLKPTISTRDKPAAPYAIVDSDGRPRAFITPAPGMNLNRYVNKPVGIYGQRGYIESLKTPHIVAERVIDLDRHLR